MMQEASPRKYEDSPDGRGFRRYLRKVLLAVAIAAAAVLLVLLLRQVGQVLLAAFAGVLVGIFLRRLATFVSRRTPLGNGSSLALVVLLILTAALAGAWFLAPSLSSDVENLTNTVPRAFEDLKDRIRDLPMGERIASALSGSWQEVLVRAASTAKDLLTHLLNFVAYALVIAAIGLYLAYSPQTYTRGLTRLLPPEKRPRAADLLLELRGILSWWIAGRLFSLFLVGALTTIGLLILGVPSAFALGTLAGVLSFIPNFGPVLSVVPAVLVAVTEGPRLALYTVLLYVGVQTLESGFITPIVERKAVSIPPALVLFSQVLLGVVFGILGLLLASPLTVTAMVLVDRLYIEDYLGESADGTVRDRAPAGGKRGRSRVAT